MSLFGKTDNEEKTEKSLRKFITVRGIVNGYTHDISAVRLKYTMVVTIAERIHLFPSRTQKLSSLTPKVLSGPPLGRIGSCHLSNRKAFASASAFLI